MALLSQGAPSAQADSGQQAQAHLAQQAQAYSAQQVQASQLAQQAQVHSVQRAQAASAQKAWAQQKVAEVEAQQHPQSACGIDFDNTTSTTQSGRPPLTTSAGRMGEVVGRAVVVLLVLHCVVEEG